MKIFILAFGKLKTPGIREAFDHYQRLARGWVNIEEIELKPISVPDKSPQTRQKIQKKEAEILLNKLQGDSVSRNPFFLLDELGKSKSTTEWSQDLIKWEASSLASVSFCIGSSLGFSDEIRKRSQGSVSFGPQTLPHELARLVLIEQLYRSYSILRKHPYHNDGS